MRSSMTLKGLLFLLLASIVSVAIHVAIAGELISEKELTEKLKLYASISTLDVSFRQTKTLKDMNLQLKSEGRLQLRRPDRVVWEITQPSPVRVSLDHSQIEIQTGTGPDTQVQTIKTGEAPSEQAAQSLTALIAWLSLDSHALASQYLITSSGKQ